MSLTIELSKTEEQELETAATHAGLTLQEYAHQLLLKTFRQQTASAETTPDWETELHWAQEQARQAFVASGKTEDELVQDTEAAVDSYRAEVYARTTPALGK